MKKIMYFAAALLVLAGCRSSQEARENAPAEMVTIKGRIELPQGPNKIAPQSDWNTKTEGEDINFQWKLGDEVSVCTQDFSECKKFIVTSVDESGTAILAGEALSSGMDNYLVFYPYMDITSTLTKEQASNAILLQQTYKQDSFKPIVTGLGVGNAFTLSIFDPAVHLQLKGTVVLGKIEYRGLESGGQAEEETLAQMTFGTGLQLDNTTLTDVVLFVPNNEESHGFELSFYGTAGQLIMKKQSETELAQGTITPFPVLTVAEPFVPTYVDLGLPSGLKWATCNVGATNPEDYGDYFAWGETEPYYSSLSPLTWKTGKTSGYADDWSSYFDAKYDEEEEVMTFTKYKNEGGKTVLESTEDAAAVNWGGVWRMPTEADFTELLNEANCTRKWCNGTSVKYENTTVKGWLFTSETNGNKLFLPAAGFFNGASRSYAGSIGFYWSASLDTSNSGIGRDLYFYSGNVYMYLRNRYFGHSVRPVCQ